MWVIWWNAILNNQAFEVHKELDFAWANSHTSKFDTCKILHYTGSAKDNRKIFNKSDYIHYSPFYAYLNDIDATSCSWHLKKLIDDYLSEQRLKRINLLDISFLIPVRIDSDDRLENV